MAQSVAAAWLSVFESNDDGPARRSTGGLAPYRQGIVSASSICPKATGSFTASVTRRR